MAGSQVESLRELGLLNLAREWMKFVFDDPLGEGVSHGYVKKKYMKTVFDILESEMTVTITAMTGAFIVSDPQGKAKKRGRG